MCVDAKDAGGSKTDEDFIPLPGSRSWLFAALWPRGAIIEARVEIEPEAA
jgi:hypothetical protein